MKYEIINVRKKELGLNNAQIAERTGITLSTIDKITSGANQNPKLVTLTAIADVLGLDLDDFKDKPKKALSEEGIRFIERLEALDPHGKAVVKAVLDLEYERCASE